MASDLRGFLEKLGPRLLRVKKEVDPKTDLGALVEQCSGPVLFENIKGHPGWTVCDLLLSNRDCHAIALGVDPKKVVPELAEKIRKGPGPTKLLKTGPCKEIVLKGGDVDLGKLPVAVHSQKDAGPVIGSGLNVTKDPQTGIRNIAMLRMEIKSKDHTGVFMVPRHNWLHWRKHEELGKDMPMAVAIGVHPAYEIAANYSGVYGLDELALAASILGEPSGLVKCETVDLEVPAHAEIVLEGYIPHGIREDEGPFGEFTDYHLTERAPQPIFKVTAITMRRNAIYRHVQSTRFTDHQPLLALPMEAVLYDRLKDVQGYINIHDVHVPTHGTLFLVVIQLTAQFEGQVKDVLAAALSSPYMHPKVAVAVDEDVNIYDLKDVWWAIATRVNPAKDLVILPQARIHPLDPSGTLVSKPGSPRWQRVGGKLGIDATKPPACWPEERALFDRALPMGWGEAFLENFL